MMKERRLGLSVFEDLWVPDEWHPSVTQEECVTLYFTPSPLNGARRDNKPALRYAYPREHFLAAWDAKPFSFKSSQVRNPAGNGVVRFPIEDERIALLMGAAAVRLLALELDNTYWSPKNKIFSVFTTSLVDWSPQNDDERYNLYLLTYLPMLVAKCPVGAPVFAEDFPCTSSIVAKS